MAKKYSLSTKLVAIGAILLIVALTSIGLTLWVTWQLEGGAAAVKDTLHNSLDCVLDVSPA